MQSGNLKKNRIMLETDESKSSGVGTHASKKRKMGERVVVAVKIEENEKRQQRSEGPPSDCWSWRKYGQKPIKGSPYPRGYYRCSTSKGCSAKKHVERCKTDGSMLIVTYTSSHNHPSPAFSLLDNQKTEAKEINIINSGPQVTNSRTMEQEQQQEQGQETGLRHPEVTDSKDHNEKNPELQTLGVLYERDPNPISQLMKSEENDFFDELEELPTSSFFTSLMKSFLNEDIVIVSPTWS